jgi:hypothetical protein
VVARRAAATAADFLLDVGMSDRAESTVRTIDVNQPVANVPVASGQISANAVRPYPGFASINDYVTDGNSLYHSLQVSCETVRAWTLSSKRLHLQQVAGR